MLYITPLVFIYLITGDNCRTLKLNLEKEMKYIDIGMEKIKSFLFAGDMIVCIDNTKEV